MRKFLLIAISSLMLFAAEPITISSGGEKGNYFGMANDIAKYCKSIAEINVVPSSGSIDNLNAMTNKSAQIGIVQTDTLMTMAKNQPRDVNQQNMKIIAGLHIETIHLLIPIGYSVGELSKWNKLTGKELPPVTSIQQLKGIAVASYGGSLVSAAALNEFFGLGWDISNVPADKLGSSGLPIVLVGGVPYKPVEEILKTGRYQLMSIPYDTVRSVAPFYIEQGITYTINSRPISVRTLGVQAMLIGKHYRSPDRNAVMEKIATCVEKSILDMADDSQTNSNWVSVAENQKIGNLVNWSFFNLSK